jgi:hypothetical protein
MKSLQEKNTVVAKAFVMFLKANNAFIGYMRATRNKNNNSTFASFLKNFPKAQTLSECKWTGFIFNAFAWCDTVECRGGNVGYWSRLNDRWLNVLANIKNNDYEISEDISRAILTRGN